MLAPLLTPGHSSDRSLAALMLAMFTALATAATDARAQSSAPAGQPRPGVTVFQGQAAQLGVKSCAGLIAQLGDSLTQGARFTANTQAQKNAPNDHAVQAVAGLAYDAPGYQGKAAGIVFTAPTRSGCEGNLVRVAPFTQSCQDVVRLLPKGSALTADLSGTPLYTLGGNQGQALLVASGPACVVVTVASAMAGQ